MRRHHIAWIWVSLASVLLLVFMWWNYSPPSQFPDERQLLREMNDALNQFGTSDQVAEIQKVIQADRRHVAVPYISEDGNYGMSFWIWGKWKWKLINLESNGEPRLWMIDRNDPSSYFLTWNIAPETGAKKLNAYMIRRRDFGMMDGKNYYSPRIQMSKEIVLTEESFGAISLPPAWQEVLQSAIRLDETETFSWFDSYPPSAMQYEFGWNALDRDGKSVSQEVFFNGTQYSFGSSDFQYMMVIDERELE
ncbi:hypothetical protein M3197_13015 [Sporosarcina aquimarina]|uniref:hypothetical protein n=1 Tax=Sporosarcina aquimarina TaxID=114975 RepID=UPI00203B10A0|nr:hypothetical protein [Sporosarcina aquimarina]MCM3758384.1 hypothetical protein [Sporosarcina aquimarina]